MEDRRGIRYRADIDGLRAVAVLSVFLFHLDFSWVPGGYTGVDIFFVISGFLITRIIGREIEQDEFSLRAFYVRRIRRILPVFLTVVLVTMVAGAILLLPADLYALLSSIRRALYFTANLYFSKSGGYFDITSDEKPLLHVWSLSIEEQYYFIWPLLLLLFYWVGVRVFKQRKILSQPVAIVLTACFIIAGFAYAQIDLLRHPGDIRPYFILQTRFGELMIGAITALLPFYDRRPMMLRLLACAGMVLVLLGLFLLDKESLFPGVNALLPCVGAALLIYSGQTSVGRQSIGWVHRLLSMRLMAGIGLLSYSLYLWHWPILAYMRYVYGRYELPWEWILCAVGLAFFLALLSYHLIERNTKAVSLTFAQALIGVFVIPSACIVAVTYGLQKMRPIVAMDTELASYGEDVCHGSFDKRCVRGDIARQPTVLVIGDSHAAALNEFIDVVGKHEGWSAQVLTASSCSPVFGYDEMALPAWAHEPCKKLKDFVRQNYHRYNVVVIASSWAYQLGMLDEKSDPGYSAKLNETLREMAESVPVYVISDVSRLPIHPFRQQWFTHLGLHIDRPVSGKYNLANETVEEMVRGIVNVHWVDLTQELSEFQHQGMYKGRPAFFDEHHLNIYGARALGELFIQQGGRLLRP